MVLMKVIDIVLNGYLNLFFKRIRASFNTVEQKRLLMDLDVSMRLAQYPYTVQFYGALFKEVTICCIHLLACGRHFF